MFLDILQNSQENTCARVSILIKLLTRPATSLKYRFWHRYFPVNFPKEHLFYRIRLGDCFYKTTEDPYILVVFFNFQVACNCSNSSKQEVKHSFYNQSVKGEKYQLDLSELLMSWSDCFLSQSKFFDQLLHRKTKQKQK